MFNKIKKIFCSFHLEFIPINLFNKNRIGSICIRHTHYFHAFALCFGRKLNPSGTFPSNISLKMKSKLNKAIALNMRWRMKIFYDNLIQSAEFELAISVSMSSRPL